MAKGFAPNQGQHYADGLIWLGLLIQRSIKSGTVTATTSATAIPTTALSKRKSILIINISSVVVYIGASDVTTSNGFPLYPRAIIHLSIEDNISVYGIVASGTGELRCLEGA